MWFKNLQCYCLKDVSLIKKEELDSLLQEIRFVAPSSLEKTRLGCVPPIDDDNALCFIDGERVVIKFKRQDKILPAPIINEEVKQRLLLIEEQEQRKLNKSEKAKVKDDVITELLPKAFSKNSFITVFLYLKEKLIFIDVSNKKLNEECLSLLRRALGSLPVVNMSTNKSPSLFMTELLRQECVHSQLDILNEVDFMLNNQENSMIKIKNCVIPNDETEQALQSGFAVGKMLLLWNDSMSFLLEHDFSIKRIKYFIEDDEQYENNSEEMKGNYLIMLDELLSMVMFLVELCEGFSE